MKITSPTVVVLLAGLASFRPAQAAVPTRQRYPLAPARIQANAARVARDIAASPASWRSAPLVYYTVPAISPVKRLSDSFPADGTALAPLEYVAAQGEYEAGSIQVFPLADVDRFELRPQELKSRAGAVIPAAALDIKVVKIWYQGGSAWSGYFADVTRRVLCPELLLYDEDLVRVDPATQDNYIRYDQGDGTQAYEWMSFINAMVNFGHTGQAKVDLINDAAMLQSTVLNKDEFKQYFITLGVPEQTPGGLYRGAIELVADGRTVGAVPVHVRVLPFTLPRPRTNYNLEKEFHGSTYWQPQNCSTYAFTNPNLLENLRRHNVLNPLLTRSATVSEAPFKRQIEALQAAGLSTRPLFGMAPSANQLVRGETPTFQEQAALDAHRAEIRRAVKLARDLLGHAEIYSYGIDEAGPETVRQEQSAWKINHEEGAKVMVTTYPRGRLLYALDYIIIPGAPGPSPNPWRRQEVERFHEMNPASLAAWYADPHSGPENPDYFRRVHGLLPYKSNYDNISNYVWYRNNWNDFAVMYEPQLRGLMMVYPTRDNVLDTLAWEGVREGLDDIRYATKLKLAATEALASHDADVKLLGRKALGMLAFFDESRDDMDQFRQEAIHFILKLERALKGAK